MPGTGTGPRRWRNVTVPKSGSGPFTPFHPRTYQCNMMRAYRIGDDGRPVTKRGVAVWHRRAGKDTTALGGVFLPAMAARPGNYFLVYPYFAEGKRAIWQENSFMRMFPAEWNPVPMETELYVRMTIGGKVTRLYIIGADDERSADKLRGTNPFGVVYSEAPQMDGRVADVLTPALMENRGWELKIGTPKGKNDFYKEFVMAMSKPETHYAEILTVDNTRRDAVDLDGNPLPGEDGSPVITPEMIQYERDRGKSEEWIQQEFYCSFEGFAVGTIYGDCLADSRQRGNITQVPYDPNKPVGVWLDIGRDDPTAIVFYQTHGSAIRIFDYHAQRQWETGACIAYLLSKPYQYGRVTLPHDARASTFNAPDSIEWKFKHRMRCKVETVDKSTNKQIGIDLVRAKFPRFVFDETACRRAPSPTLPSLLDSLGNYRRGWSAERQDNSGPPMHDQFSHGADAVRVGVEGWRENLDFEGEREDPVMANCKFNVFETPRDRMKRIELGKRRAA